MKDLRGKHWARLDGNAESRGHAANKYIGQKTVFRHCVHRRDSSLHDGPIGHTNKSSADIFEACRTQTCFEDALEACPQIRLSSCLQRNSFVLMHEQCERSFKGCPNRRCAGKLICFVRFL